MVMANAAQTGNCRRRSVKGKVLSEGMSVMRGISTCLPLCRPVQISALITFGCSCFTTNRVPLSRPLAGSGWLDILFFRMNIVH